MVICVGICCNRCRAIEVMGIMIEHLAGPGSGAAPALGPEAVSWAVSTVTQGWSLNYSELREYGHGLYACTAKVMTLHSSLIMDLCMAHLLSQRHYQYVGMGI
jgi:hypothetical protein